MHHYHVIEVDRDKGVITFGPACSCRPVVVRPPPVKKPKHGQKRRSSKKRGGR